jgi:Sec-independent protein translocase protein TatA
MELLGIGPLELAFIILIAVIVIGPRDIGKFARGAGRFLNRLYHSEEWKALNQASRNFDKAATPNSSFSDGCQPIAVG